MINLKLFAITFGTHIAEDGKTAIFDELNWTAEDVAAFNKILIVACGTAYHARSC